MKLTNVSLVVLKIDSTKALAEMSNGELYELSFPYGCPENFNQFRYLTETEMQKRAKVVNADRGFNSSYGRHLHMSSQFGRDYQSRGYR